jgi:hypothetical protein
VGSGRRRPGHSRTGGESEDLASNWHLADGEISHRRGDAGCSRAITARRQGSHEPTDPIRHGFLFIVVIIFEEPRSRRWSTDMDELVGQDFGRPG